MSIYSKQDPLRFYVYAYLRKDNSPYYIGKGQHFRAWKHSSLDRIRSPIDLSRIVMLETNLTEFGALALERRMIRWYGRKDNNSGILRNLTDGGEGCAGYWVGKKRPEHGAKMSTNSNPMKKAENRAKLKAVLAAKPKLLKVPKTRITKLPGYIHPANDPNKYWFEEISTGRLLCLSRKEFIGEAGAEKSGVSLLVAGKRRQCNGWIIR